MRAIAQNTREGVLRMERRRSQQRQHLQEVEANLCARIASMLEEQRATRSAHPVRERPRIGVFAARGTLREGAWVSYAGDAYTIDALAEAGGYPLALPTFPVMAGLDPFDLLTDEEAFACLFDIVWPIVRDLDGLVFTGGGDLDARLFYRRIPHPQLQPPDVWRDTFEWFAALISWVLCKSTFGICRGAQLMNVVLGGSLFQDQEELQRRWHKDRPPLLAHRRGRPIFKNLIRHPLHIVPHSLLAQAVKNRGMHAASRPYLDEVFSQHHNFIGVVQPDTMQVMGNLAHGLMVVGYAPDGVVEAIAAKDPRRLYWAVQFHPEYMRTLSWAASLFSFIVEGAARDASIPRALFESFRKEVLAWLWLYGRTLHDLRPSSSALLPATLPLGEGERRADEDSSADAREEKGRASLHAR
jgi:putative glutamine amidotransferase